MKSKSLLILVAVTLATVLAAALAVKGRGSASAQTESGVLFPDLKAKVNDVTQIEIQSGADSTTLERQEGRWVVPALGGYPARFGGIKETLLQVADLEIVEPKTNRPENFGKLEVEDPGGAEARSTALRVLGAGGEELAQVVLGKTVFQRSGQRIYARRAGENQVYLCEGEFTLAADPKTWVDREILRLAADRVAAVSIAHADGETLQMSKSGPAESNYNVADVPTDRHLSNQGAANPVAAALAYLSLDDVRPAAELALEENRYATATYETFEGLRVLVHLAKVEELSWVTLEASFAEAPESAGPEPEGEGASVDTGTDVDVEPFRAEARELAERVNGWAFQIADYKADVLARRMEDLLAPLPAEGEAPADTSGLLPDEMPEEIRKLLEEQAGGMPEPPAEGATEPPSAEDQDG